MSHNNRLEKAELLAALAAAAAVLACAAVLAPAATHVGITIINLIRQLSLSTWDLGMDH